MGIGVKERYINRQKGIQTDKDREIEGWTQTDSKRRKVIDRETRREEREINKETETVREGE